MGLKISADKNAKVWDNGGRHQRKSIAQSRNGSLAEAGARGSKAVVNSFLTLARSHSAQYVNTQLRGLTCLGNLLAVLDLPPAGVLPLWSALHGAMAANLASDTPEFLSVCVCVCVCALGRKHISVYSLILQTVTSTLWALMRKVIEAKQGDVLSQVHLHPAF
jgi:hypothetical protein